MPLGGGGKTFLHTLKKVNKLRTDFVEVFIIDLYLFLVTSVYSEPSVYHEGQFTTTGTEVTVQPLIRGFKYKSRKKKYGGHAVMY